jgi:hypothetical protein
LPNAWASPKRACPSYVVALGGTLDVVADFGDHSVKVA